MVKKRNKTCPIIISEGHRYWVDKEGNDHITFFDNLLGKKLRAMWEELHRPIKQND